MHRIEWLAPFSRRSVASVREAPLEPHRSSSRSVGSRRSVSTESTLCEVFPIESSGDGTACRRPCSPRTTERAPSEVGPGRSLRLPRWAPELALRWRARPSIEFPRPDCLASRGAALSREPPSPSPLLSHALPHEHDLNASLPRRALKSSLAGDPSKPSARGVASLHETRGEQAHLGERLRGRAPSPADPSFRVSSPWAPAGVMGEEAWTRAPLVAPAGPSSGRRAPSEESVELPSRNQSRACARFSPKREGALAGSLVRTASRWAPREGRPRARARGAIHRTRARRAVAGSPAGLARRTRGTSPR